MTRSLALLLALAGCTSASDKGIDTDSDTAPDSGDPDSDSGDSDSGDSGDPDSGDPDSGDSGEPSACELDLPPAGTVATDASCAPGGADVDPFEMVLERRLIGAVPRHTPVVGHVDDDDGDGRVGPGDRSEAVVVDRYGSSWGSELVVWGQDDRTPLWEIPDGFHGDFDPLVADLDGDGFAEVVAIAGLSDWYIQMVALDGRTGAELWRTEYLLWVGCSDICTTTAADLDADGVAEVILDNTVVDGATGAIERVLEPPDMTYRAPLVADLDGDGLFEIVLGDTAFDDDGAILWSYDGVDRSAFPALVQLDDDALPEVAVALDYDLLLLDDDGAELFRGAVPGAVGSGWAGSPCVGDIDGDGASEVVVPGGRSIDAFEADGSVAWSGEMWGTDGTGYYAGATGCTLFDFDRDGDHEVLFGDPFGLRILDGRTGDVLAHTTQYTSGMYQMVPVVADIDGDGSAEILAASTGHILRSDDSWSGLQVYGHPRDAWRTEGTVWGMHDFAVGNQTAAGGFPAAPVDTWSDGGLFRGQRAVPAPGEALPALVVEVVDACVAGDDDRESVAVTVGNVGAVEAVGAWVELRAVADDGSARVLASAELDGVGAGRVAAGVELAWAPSEVVDGERVEVVAGSAGEATCAAEERVVVVTAGCE